MKKYQANINHLMNHRALIAWATLALVASSPLLSADPTTAASGDRPKMMAIPGGTFDMGAAASDRLARADERPVHRVTVSAFLIGQTEVTNKQFMAFVKSTGYVTTAELKPDWDELKKTVPPGTPKPPDDVLVPGALLFVPPPPAAPARDLSWWQWTQGASWRHPHGPGSDLAGKDDHPVVLVSWDDAVAYARWAGGRLPTEAEWEWAARGGVSGARFPWGDAELESGVPKANTWQGRFPAKDTAEDGFAGIAPVARFAPNGYGLHDMAGNVWEWVGDYYRPDTYCDAAAGPQTDPKGPTDSLDPNEPGMPKRVVRGGSFLCHASYCASYRVTARMKSSPDTGLSHTGFRIVKNISATPTTMP